MGQNSGQNWIVVLSTVEKKTATEFCVRSKEFDEVCIFKQTAMAAVKDLQ